jgi:diguanylate cyclase (GGDEF)-like protein
MTSTVHALSIRDQIAFFWRHVPLLAKWPVVSGVLLIGLWLWIGSTLHRETHETRAHAYQAASTQARTYAEQIDRSIAHLDYIMQSLQFQWQENGGRLNLEKQLNAGLVPKAAQISVTLFDRLGMPVTSTHPAIMTKQSVAAAETFRAHLDRPDQDMMIFPPRHSIITGRDVIILSRRLEAPDGTFAGVLMVAIAPDFLASFVDESNLGEGNFVAVRGTDGAFFVSKTRGGIRSRDPIFIGQNDRSDPTATVYRPADQYQDHKSRIVSWNTLAHYPLRVVVGLRDETISADYQSRSRELYLTGFAGTLLLSLLGIAGLRRCIFQARHIQYAREIHEAYRMATENAREGFYMLRPLYGPDRAVTDFLIEDCNERGARYRARPKEALIGKTMSAVLPIISEAYMLTACHQAMETGFFEGEKRFPARGAQAAQWLHIRMVRSSAGLAVTLRDTTEGKAHEETLVQLVNADAVTTLPNRYWLMQHLPVAVEHARTTHTQLAVMFVDLDDFKNINDTLGHAVGDQLLRAAALRLQAVIGPDDTIARLGGDEFTIIVQAAERREDVAMLAERVIDTLKRPFVLGNGDAPHFVHASIGMSLFPQDGSDGETLLKRADIAMYAAKAAKKGTFCFFEAIQEQRLVMRLTREAELKQGIGRGELILHYQPRVRSDTGEITSMEALVRWVHPTLGLLPPSDFIAMAEITGLIVPLGAEVVRLACRQLAHWKRQGLQVVPISVNVSAQQIDTGTVSSMLVSALKENGLETHLLEVEVTESATVTKHGTAVTELAAIQHTGIKLYVDDFGTGYSCLAQLKDLDMDGLKIDRAFTSRLGNSSTDAALFEAIVSMAHALAMRVVAEGVETVEQLAVLRALGCEEVQGYYISRPVAAAEAGLLLEKRFLFPST